VSNRPVFKFSSTGFTLVELIVLSAIIAILASMTAPIYLSYIPRARLKGAVRMVMVDLMAARMKAIKLNTRTQVFFINEHQYVICDDANHDKTVENGEGDAQLRDIQKDYSDVTLSTTNNPKFLPRGSATSMATITLTNPGGLRKVAIAITGRIKHD
jgi:type IV fimbrial biogenesis protein FimT